MTQPTRPYDCFKDSPLRYLGYTNEVGEAFRNIIGKQWVEVSYGVATLYVIADTLDKTSKAFTRNAEGRFHKALFAGSDTFIWQMLASVIIPGYAINRICAFSNNVLVKTNKRMPAYTRNLIVACIGLASVPIIIKPIDNSVDYVLDRTLRKLDPSK